MIMTAFFEVWRFTYAIGLISVMYSVSLAGPKRVVPDRATSSPKFSGLRPRNLHVPVAGVELSHFRPMLERVFAFKVFPAGIEPASVIVSDRSTYELRFKLLLRRARSCSFVPFQ